jgi:hypothetical protein
MSNESQPTDAVRALLSEQVDTFDKLEIVVTMAGDPKQRWTLDALTAALRVSAVDLRPVIDELRASGVVRRVPGATYCLVYAPQDSLAVACAELCRLYQIDRSWVVRALRDVELARVRRSTADDFADAFRIRRPRPEPSDE